YAARIPSPPRILIPAALPDSRVTTESIPYSNPPSTSPIARVFTSASLDWTYTQRRSAQPILPHLYLGPIQAAKDISFLHTAHITLLLGIRQSNPFQLAAHKKVAQLASDLHIPSETVEADTLPQLISSFARITSIINTHTSSLAPGKGRVLLFCESGNDRGAGACAAYLMSVLEGVDHVKAMQLVQGQRFCCNFDEALKRLLQGYWDIIRAEREV
ncbi:protein-tyrosine phosphatase-like protein, partial [Elsinoe ampelina]